MLYKYFKLLGAIRFQRRMTINVFKQLVLSAVHQTSLMTHTICQFPMKEKFGENECVFGEKKFVWLIAANRISPYKLYGQRSQYTNTQLYRQAIILEMYM